MSVFLFALVSVSLNIFPRFDGVVLEFTGDSLLEPSVAAYDMTLTLRFREEIEPVDWDFLPFWIESLSVDSRSLSVTFASEISGVDWALSLDSLTMIVFARAREPVQLPPVSWVAPPPQPDTSAWSDSLLYAALERGEESPWLEDFDCVVIDPGHGGRDAGAVGYSGSREKDRTLEIALMVRDLLKIRLPELKVVLTRTTDKYVSLGARTRMANRNHADLFVSIHCNASTNSSANGFETYFLSNARTDDARAVQMFENKVSEMDESFSEPVDPLSFILADMAQSIFQNQSSRLAGSIQNSLARALPERRNRGVKRAGFYVLRGAYMPAVLVEVGFISNPGEEELLKSLDFRFKLAEAIVDSIVEHSESEN